MSTTTMQCGLHTVQLEHSPTPFAHVLDRPGLVAYMVYVFPAEGTSNAAWLAWVDATMDAGPVVELRPVDEPLVLPFLIEKFVKEVAEHAYYAPAPLLISAMVAAHRGQDALHEYADTQNMYNMPGAPKIPEDELRWLDSGL